MSDYYLCHAKTVKRVSLLLITGTLRKVILGRLILKAGLAQRFALYEQPLFKLALSPGMTSFDGRFCLAFIRLDEATSEELAHLQVVVERARHDIFVAFIGANEHLVGNGV